MTEAKTAPIYSRRSALQLMIAGATGLAGSNLLGQPAFARTTTAKPTGRVVVGLGQEPTVFNPLMAHIEVDDGVHFSVFDALFRIDPQGVIRIRLRDDARWHDGTPFSSEDVKFTLELIMNPNFRSWRTAGHALVRDITVISPTEISWRMEEAFAPYLSFLTETFIVPKHILGKESNPNNAAFNQAPVGTGPFKWGQRVAGDHLELVANPDYFGEGPHIERLVFKYIPDLTVLYTQFKSGDIDLVGQPYITPDHYGEAKMLPNRTVTLVPRTAFESFYLNLERPQFKELAVREALYAAIDKEAIIQGLYYGVPSPTETFMPRQSFFFNPNLPLHQFDVNRAGKILDQAGWAKGADGIRAKNGVRLSFTNSTTSGDPLREQVQQYLQQTFAQLGVEMKISNLPAAVMWGEFWGQSKFDSVIVGSTYLIGADPDVTNRLHSRSIAAKGGRGSNNAQFPGTGTRASRPAFPAAVSDQCGRRPQEGDQRFRAERQYAHGILECAGLVLGELMCCRPRPGRPRPALE